jgi:hypothetical protein
MGVLVHEAWAWAFLLIGMLGSASGLYLWWARSEPGPEGMLGAVCEPGAFVSGIVLFSLLVGFLCMLGEPRKVNLSTKQYAHKGRVLECPRCQGRHHIWHDWDVTPDAAWAKYAVACRWCRYQIKGGEEPPRGEDGVPVWTVIVGFLAGLAGGACLNFLGRVWRVGKALVKGGSKVMSMLEAVAEKDAKS